MEWRTIEDFEDYLISSCGLVKSKNRFIKRFNGRIFHNKAINERILKPSLTGSGYAFVSIRKNGKSYNCRIHVLVAENFISKRPNGLVINHKDGNKLNNNVDNLEFVSKQRNTQHYYKMIGKSNGFVNYKDIPNIINRVSTGENVYSIAKEYDVSRNDIAVLCKIIKLTSKELQIKL